MLSVTDTQIDDYLDSSVLEWSREDVRRVIRLYLAKNSIREIAKAEGVAYNTLRRMFTILGVEMRTRGADLRIFTDEEEAFFLKCHRRGLTVEELRTFARCSRETMTKSLKRARIRNYNVQS